jgi:hypothetical protein
MKWASAMIVNDTAMAMPHTRKQALSGKSLAAVMRSLYRATARGTHSDERALALDCKNDHNGQERGASVWGFPPVVGHY